MKNFKKWFFAGLAALLPLGLTIFIFVWLFNLIDGLTEDLIIWIFGRKYPGLGFAATIVILVLVGMLTSNFIGRRITHFVEKVLGKIPIVKAIYNPVRKIISGFSSKTAESFKKAVLIEFPKQGSKSIGFITNNSFTVDSNNMISVFVPTTPNPTNGFLVLVKREYVEILDVPVNEALNMVVSMGSSIEGDIRIVEN
jgi:uncharacterized membrane protein